MSALAPLISCPRKQTQDVDIAASLKQIIATVYEQDPSTFAEECTAINRTRQDALRGSAGSDLTLRDLLLKYFGQLELLELRFPDLRVQFPWSDAFTLKQISQSSLAYEKASVIFNIASCYSSLAASSSRSSNEGLKRSFNFFRQAAGMFTYINENFLHAPSTDLSKEIIKSLVVLMIAQATEVFYERMCSENKSPGLKARVCATIAAHYHSIQDDVKGFVNTGWFTRSWSLLVQCKAAHFAALTQYNKALQDQQQSKYGDAITRLQIASNSCREATRLSAGFASVFSASLVPTLPADATSSLNELTKTTASLVNTALTNSRRENDLIYHASPTSEAALPVVEKSTVAEPITIQEIYSNPDVQKVVGQDIFIRLVPLQVIESASLYTEEKDKMVRAQTEACGIADTELSNALDYLSLPASLSKFKAGFAPETGVPSYVLEWSRRIRSNATLPSTLATLKELNLKVVATLSEASKTLDADERECESARRQSETFDQAPSASIAEFKALRADIKSRQSSLQAASTSDAVVFDTYERAKSDLALLGDEARLEEAFNVASVAGSAKPKDDLLGDLEEGTDKVDQDDIKKQTDEIDDVLDRLNKMKRERQEVLKDLKERVQMDDISHLLILNRKAQNIETALFAAELEKFKPHQSRLAATIHHQSALIQQLMKNYQRLTEGNVAAKKLVAQYAASEKARKELIARLSAAHEAFVQAEEGSAKGVAFYRELLDLASELKANANKFAQKRRSERSTATSMAAPAGLNLDLDDQLRGLTLNRSEYRLPPTSPTLALPPRPISYTPATSAQPPSSYMSSPVPTTSVGSYQTSALPSAPQQPQSYTPHQQQYAPPQPQSPSYYSQPSQTYSQQQGQAQNGPSVPMRPYSQQGQSTGYGLPPPPAQMQYASQTTLPAPPRPLSYATPPPGQNAYAQVQQQLPYQHQQQQQPYAQTGMSQPQQQYAPSPVSQQQQQQQYAQPPLAQQQQQYGQPLPRQQQYNPYYGSGSGNRPY